MVWSVETTCVSSWNCLLDSPKHQSMNSFLTKLLSFPKNILFTFKPLEGSNLKSL